MSPEETLNKLTQWANNIREDPTIPPPELDPSTEFDRRHEDQLAQVLQAVRSSTTTLETQFTETANALKNTKRKPHRFSRNGPEPHLKLDM